MRNNVAIVIGAFGLLISSVNTATANCDNGVGVWEVVSHVNDVFFSANSGTQQETTVRGIIRNIGGSTSEGCGLQARTFIPGLYMQDGYAGGVNDPFVGPGNWVKWAGSELGTVGEERGFGGGILPGIGRKLRLDPGQPAVSGTIELAMVDGDINPTYTTVGYIDVYVDSAGMTVRNTWFIARATAANISGNALILNHPRLNNNPNAKLFISALYTPYDGIVGNYDNNPVSVKYDTPTGRWRIQHDNGVAMAQNTAFNVRIDGAGFVVTTNSFTSQSTLVLNDTVSTGNRSAIISVTPRNAGVAITHPLTVEYNSTSGHWQIRFSDGVNMPAKTSFFVRTLGYGSYWAAGSTPVGSTYSDGLGWDAGGGGGASCSRSFSWFRELPLWSWLTSAQTVSIGTNNQAPFTPAGWLNADPNPHYVTFIHDTNVGPGWYLANESQTTMPCNAAFNIWAQRSDDPMFPPPIIAN